MEEHVNHHSQKADDKNLFVIGVHTSSEAYPNTLYILEKLRIDFNPHEINIPLLPETGGAINLRGRRLRSTLKFITTHVRVLWRALSLRPRRCIYVPYPSTFLLLAWSFFPKQLRPCRIIADAFISIYDTVINDRQLASRDSYISKLLKSAERRAFGTANVIIVDTPQNAEFYAKTFHLPLQLFRPIPLSTNEKDYLKAPPSKKKTLNVLFVGTLIPLHGIEVILAAAELLSYREDIVFTIVGDGQEACAVENSIINGTSNLIWQRKWMPPEKLAEYIIDSSICLGIFGSTSKADRVCPYKIYAYASVGRPVITRNSSWLKQATQDYGQPPFLGIPPGDPAILADTIVRLADNTTLQEQMAEASNRFYADCLSNQKAYSQFRECLMESAGTC
ncbi:MULTISPECIES: glycosyltransferase [Xanthomonas]|uniref:Glycosyltransferase n=1 Tax=Xanthomonas dyei TaxID=743699 RepID=A0ABZ0DAT4_9XANT|nr:glycosyltransferase [Xanthomonas dyei]WOB25428.1 glycosyltransferase [Xanthomonas dyei]WOB53054.1 glycosyltransferase [Xanthomonas dyei]